MNNKVFKKRIIPKNWSLKKVSEIAKTGSGGTPLSTCKDYYNGGDIPWINSGEVGQNSIKQTSNLITKVGMENSSAKIFPAGSVLIALYGATAGKTSLLEIDATTNQAVCAIMPKKGYEAKFIKYYLDALYSYLVGISTGSARDNLNQNGIQDLEIPFPSESTQKSIAKILSDLDAKIELNNRINRELEAMAKTLYDYWFVQFDFPNEQGKPYKSSGGKMVYNAELKREIPEGWEVKKLGDLGDFKNGVNYDPSNPGEIACPLINVRNISKSSFFIQNEDLDIIYLRESDVRKYSVNEGSIIIARSGIPGATRLVSDLAENTLYCGFTIHYTIIDLRIKIPVFFFLKSLEEHIKDGSGGTILKNVNQGTLNALITPLPVDNYLLVKFNNLIEPIFSKINVIKKQNQQLSSLRDWLLPMLMNGQILVKESKNECV